MFIEVRGERYKVHVTAAANPFAISHGRVIGITPDAPEELLPEFRAVWKEQTRECNEWVVNGKWQVLRMGDRFMCDCWPFRKHRDCKHIESVKEEYDVA